jgi:hypothetical protein
LPVHGVAGALAAVLIAVSGAYGFHRDELYFIVAGQLPAWGYPDQPPLTPLLSAAAVELLGLSATAIRILPALAMAACVVCAAAMARELGGGRTAQVVGAAALASSIFLGAGHPDLARTIAANGSSSNRSSITSRR